MATNVTSLSSSAPSIPPVVPHMAPSLPSTTPPLTAMTMTTTPFVALSVMPSTTPLAPFVAPSLVDPYAASPPASYAAASPYSHWGPHPLSSIYSDAMYMASTGALSSFTAPNMASSTFGTITRPSSF